MRRTRPVPSSCSGSKALLARAEGAGAIVTWPRDRPWGIYSGYFRDPDRHLACGGNDGRAASWTLAERRVSVSPAVVAGVARTADLHGVGSTVLLGLALWLGFPLVLLTGSMLWDRVPAATALLHAGDWLLKLLVISVIVGLWL
jgi:Protein of unknown function (DUF1761)